QRPQLRACRVVEIAKLVSRNAGRHSIWFGKHDVERDHECAHLSQARNEVGDTGARPGPLTYAFEALLVDVDDDDRPFGGFARLQDLEKVKDADPQFLNWQWIEDSQRSQRKKQQEGEGACQSKAASPARKPFHRRSPVCARSAASVIFPGTPA